MFYRSFKTQNSTVNFIFICQWSGQCQVQAYVRFWNSIFSSKITPILITFISGFKKCHLFWGTLIRNVKNCTQEWNRNISVEYNHTNFDRPELFYWIRWKGIDLSLFSSNHAPRTSTCLPEIRDNAKKNRSWDCHFTVRPVLHLWWFLASIILKTVHHRSVWKSAIFLNKSGAKWRH